MKISDNFILQNVAGQNIVVPVEEKSISFKAMITLNETGAFLWNALQTDKSEQELTQLLADEYKIDIELAKADTLDFLKKLKDLDIVC